MQLQNIYCQIITQYGKFLLIKWLLIDRQINRNASSRENGGRVNKFKIKVLKIKLKIKLLN